MLEQRLPNALVLPSYPIVAGLLITDAVGTGHLVALPRAGLAMLALTGFYLLTALASHGGIGAGDIKLAGVLGLVLGFRSTGTVLTATLVGLCTAALAGAVLIATGRANRRTPVPLEPALLTGALVTLIA